MRDFTETLLNWARNGSEDIQELEPFCKKLDSFIHAPTNLKEMERMSDFAKNEKLTGVVNDFLIHYFDNRQFFEEDEYGFLSYDVIATWYALGMIIQTEKELSSAEYIFSKMMAIESPDLSIARRILNIKHSAVYDELANKVEEYFNKQQGEVEVYTWAKKIGLELPNSFDWEFYFTLYGELDPEFKGEPIVDHLMVYVRANAPKGDGESYTIDLKDRDYRIQSWWNDDDDDDRKIRIQGAKDVELKEKPSLLHFKAFLAEVEAIFGIKFDRKISSSYFSRGIKKKNSVQQWLEG